jgi:hypothetical protein
MHFPKGFHNWPPFVQHAWMRANPGVISRDHRTSRTVQAHRAGADCCEHVSSDRGVSSRDPGRVSVGGSTWV